MERTLAIIKPDAVGNRTTGRILERIETAGFTVRKMQMVTLSRAEAEGFYAVHSKQPFFTHLTTFMSSGPVLVLVLEARGAIKKWRDLMGTTDPAQAASGTIRRDFGQSIEQNATHGSDGPETALFEIGYFFPGIELTAHLQD
jgi:nucleoside-diphosphate kinase